MASQGEGGRRRAVLHGLAVPYPAQGHILPLMNLCHRLITLIPHLHITFVNTSQNHRRMLESQIHHNEEERIRLVEIDGGLPPEMHKDTQSFDAAYEAAQDLITPLDLLLQSLNPVISFILSDVLMSRTHHLAVKFGIPRVAFLPFSAAVFYRGAHLQTIMDQLPPPGEGGLWVKEEVDSMQILLPPLFPLKIGEISFIRNYRIFNALFDFCSCQYPLLHKASLILSNSFYELEKPVFEALKISCPAPIHPIGPLLPIPSLKIPALFKEERSCLAWLDGQSKPKSVLYVSFGSIHEASGRQGHELALGLEASQLPFLWVNRNENKEEIFPDPGFLDRVGDRCLIVSWCPQFEVLSHPSVGAFLTHCGWNSVMESIASGVPMACWPHTAEQRLNARFVTEQWKVGMTFDMEEQGRIVGRSQIEGIVRGVMEDEGIKKAAMEWSEVGKASLREGGSSVTNLEAFVDGLSDLRIIPGATS